MKNQKNDGNTALSEQIFKEYKSRIYGYIISKGIPFSDRDDVFNEIMLKAVSYEARYDGNKSSLSTWVYMICRSVVANYFKAKRTTFPLNEAIPSDFKVEDGLELEEQLDKLAKQLNRLPERERKIIVLRFYKDMEYGEIAGTMGISEANARKIYSRALNKLRTWM